ncbi:MAG: ATP-dependent DNA helicase [Candidatus Anstonellales archaeon]
MLFRHEHIRKHQDSLLRDVEHAAVNGKILLAHAPTGMGKTDASIGGAIEYAYENGKTLFFLTPKISQHAIALSVVDGINKKYGKRIKAVDIIGKRHCCTDPFISKLEHDDFYPICKLRVKEETCDYFRRARGYTSEEQRLAYELLSRHIKVVWSQPEAFEEAKKERTCSYEWLMSAARDADVIIADYFHIFLPGIRESFLGRSGKDIESGIIIVDEAHNLAERIRSTLSRTITSFTIARHEKEAEMLGFDPVLSQEGFDSWAEKTCKGNESVAEFPFVIDEDALGLLEHIGQMSVEKSGGNSASLRMFAFFENFNEGDNRFATILKRREKGFSLSRKLLDPSISTAILNKAHAAVLMSGTFLPLDMHAEVLGIEKHRAMLRAYNSPFKAENRLNVVVRGVTTKYSRRNDSEYKKYASLIEKIHRAIGSNIALFFPSYEVMEGVLKHALIPNAIVQKRAMGAEEVKQLIKRFKEEKSVLCCVQGGSLSEGVDFSNGEIKVAVIVGLPLSKMSLEVELMIEYYNKKFGKGWDYAYLYPAVIKSLQAAGRAIRKESDRAVAVFMEERLMWKNYLKLLPKDQRFILSDAPDYEIRKFFEGH